MAPQLAVSAVIGKAGKFAHAHDKLGRHSETAFRVVPKAL